MPRGGADRTSVETCSFGLQRMVQRPADRPHDRGRREARLPRSLQRRSTVSTTHPSAVDRAVQWIAGVGAHGALGFQAQPAVARALCQRVLQGVSALAHVHARGLALGVV